MMRDPRSRPEGTDRVGGARVYGLRLRLFSKGGDFASRQKVESVEL